MAEDKASGGSLYNKSLLSHKGMTKDALATKHPQDFYYDAENASIVSPDINVLGGLHRQKSHKFLTRPPQLDRVGDEIVLSLYEGNIGFPVASIPSFPEIGDFPLTATTKVIYIANYINNIVLFLETSAPGYGAIVNVRIENDQPVEWKLAYLNKVNFSTDHPIRRAIAIVENTNIVKVYWTDNHELYRFLNIADPESHLVKLGLIDNAPDIEYGSIEIVSVGQGGLFTAGVVQYAYSLYINNGQQSKTSPLSGLVSLGTSTQGAPVTTTVGASVNLQITGIDQNFDFIKVYRIFYTTFGADPIVSIIDERGIKGVSSLTILDDGSQDEEAFTVDELLFQGNDPFVAKDMATIENRMILMNIKQSNFDIDFDARVYKWTGLGTSTLLDDQLGTIVLNSIADTSLVPEEHDCICPTNIAQYGDQRLGESSSLDLITHLYTSDGVTYGAEGKYFILKLVTDDFILQDQLAYQGFKVDKVNSFGNPVKTQLAGYKRNETYRFGVRFINNKGQRSFVKWMTDIRMPAQWQFNPVTTGDGVNVIGHNLHLQIQLKPEGVDALRDLGVVGYEILRVSRDDNNKSILFQGVVQPTLQAPANTGTAGGPAFAGKWQPLYGLRSWHNGADAFSLTNINHRKDLNVREINSGGADANDYKMDCSIFNIFSPEITLLPAGQKLNATGGDGLIFVGGTKERGSTSKQRRENKSNQDFPLSAFGAASYNVFDSGAFGVIRSGSTDNDRRAISLLLKSGEWKVNGVRFSRMSAAPVQMEDAARPTWTSYTIDGNVVYDHIFVNREQGNNSNKLQGAVSKSLLVKIQSLSNTTFGGFDYYLTDVIGPKTSDKYFVIADYYKLNINQYGGNIYEARQRNTYNSISQIFPIDSTEHRVYGGDTFIAYFNLMRTSIFNPDNFIFGTMHKETISIPLETSYNVDFRHDLDNWLSPPIYDNLDHDFADLHKFNNVYNTQQSIYGGVAKPITFNEVTKFGNRILASDTKSYGETIDSFTRFGPLNFLDVEGVYGDIVGGVNYRNNLIVFQPNAVCRVLVEPTSLTEDTQGEEILLGTGQILQKSLYISTSSGTLNQFSIFPANSGVFYYDTLAMKIKAISPDGKHLSISDVKGMHTELRKRFSNNAGTLDNPFTFSCATTSYNNVEDTLYFTIGTSEDNIQTYSFSELTGNFVSRHTYVPVIAGYNNRDLIEVSKAGNLYFNVKGSDFGTYFEEEHPFSITYLAAPNPMMSKTFDNLQLNVEAYDNNVLDPFVCFDSLQIWNDFQTSPVLSIVFNATVQKRHKEWRIYLPREQGTMNRITSQYAFIKLAYNSSNLDIINHDVILGYTLDPGSFV